MPDAALPNTVPARTVPSKYDGTAENAPPLARFARLPGVLLRSAKSTSQRSSSVTGSSVSPWLVTVIRSRIPEPMARSRNTTT